MSDIAVFDRVLDEIEHLSPEEQAELVAVVQRRLAERGRQRVVADVRDARSEFNEGLVTPTTVDDLIREVGS